MTLIKCYLFKLISNYKAFLIKIPDLLHLRFPGTRLRFFKKIDLFYIPESYNLSLA